MGHFRKWPVFFIVSGKNKETMKKTILIAEDEHLLLEALKYKFQSEGFTVTTAGNGQEALSLLSTEPFDMVVADISMPYMTGLELLEASRTQVEALPPFIILSALGTEHMIVKAFKLGVNDFVTKPFSPDELMIRVKRQLGMHLA